MIFNKSWTNIIIPVILCFFGLVFIYKELDFYPLLFGLAIGLSNWSIHKYKPYLGITLSILISYISYGIGILSFACFGYLFKYLNFDDASSARFLYLVSSFIIAPLTLFLLFRFLFEFPKTKKTVWIIIFSICMLSIQYYFYAQNDDLTSSEISVFDILNPYISWQIIIALALQLIIFQNELRKTR